MLDVDESLRALGMTLAEYAAWRGMHVQAAREGYREMMRSAAGVTLPEPTRMARDGVDGTVKFCLPAGTQGDVPTGKALEAETVIIPMISYRGSSWHTLCVSSQVGCRMGCTFCETGRMGLLRNLSAGEIVRQRLAAMRIRVADRGGTLETPAPTMARGGGRAGGGSLGSQPYFADGIQNIVFMGMGEPLDNFENLVQAIRVFTEPQGMNFPHGQITVSTVGRIDGLKKLGAMAWPNLRIAISLNAAVDRLRDELMPINKGMPLADLKAALREYPMSRKGLYLIEYVLIKGVNDSAADANAVADFCAGLRCIVNVIPYNPQRFASFETPADETVLAFMSSLKERGIFVKRRVTHGRELMGACGQLGNPEIRRKPAAVQIESLRH